ncbi:MAG TPA: tetratricopeptide repeat protein [Candidatus Sulfotelmatobacter sp.]|nr:tetratricopeptide repeat protein [Candidatus Sulfotelmatobacter sp.]
MRRSERGGGIGAGIRCVLLLLASALVSAHGQTQGGGSDWANLAPPPGVSDTNSPQNDFDVTNIPVAESFAAVNSPGTNKFRSDLAMARYYRKSLQSSKAESTLLGLLAPDVPESVQRVALLQLAEVVCDENDLPRAQTIYAQFLDRWPDDARVPEVYLQQGEIFRRMGLTDLALSKFYSVMAAALSLKNDQFGYYQKLVLRTQVEIADTHYLMGQFVDAADFYNRLLQNPDPALDRPEMQFRLVRSLTIIGRNDEAASQAQDFLSRYPDADQTPEVRYYLAQALKALGRDDDALQEVLLCLKQQKARMGNDSAVWTYWQQRVGNEIGNQLYHEGDYVHALEIYIDLAQLDPSATWQVPVDYQMGLTYEKLSQLQKAQDIYTKIVGREAEVGTNATPGMQAVFDMAKWRIDFLKWEQNAQAADRSVAATAVEMTGPTNSTNNIAQ